MKFKKTSSVLFTLFTACIGFSQLTYNEVAPLLYKHCGDCHRPGGGAPFSMLTYSETYPWVALMKHAIEDGDMPPWSTDTNYLHYSNERILPVEDKNTIIDWINGLAPEGDPTKAPAHPNYPEYMINGEPDLIVQMDPFTSNAQADVDAYNTLVVPTGLDTTRVIRALELIPEDPELTHHIVINADTAGQIIGDQTGTNFDVDWGDIAIGGYQPGTNPIVYPNSDELKIGVRIPANADLILQIHTPAGTAGREIKLQVRLYFYPKETTDADFRPIYTVVTNDYWGNDFWFAPEEIKTYTHERKLDWQQGFNLSIYSALPHSHQICTEVKNYAYKGSDTIKLLKIDRWDFEHQTYYYYNKFKIIPPDYTFKAIHKYENTSSNHHNPFNPPKTITVGTNSTDEMLFDAFQFVVYEPGDEYINIDSIIKADTIMQYPTYTGIDKIDNKTIQLVGSYAAPNPIVNNSAIYFYHPHERWSDYSLKVYSTSGKLVDMPYKVNNGYITISKGILDSGQYFYEIFDKNKLLSKGNLLIK